MTGVPQRESQEVDTAQAERDLISTLLRAIAYGFWGNGKDEEVLTYHG